MGLSFQQIKEWIRAHERHVSSLALLSGFIIDAFTLKRIDLLFENMVLIGYFVVVGLSISLLHIFESKRQYKPFLDKISTFLPIIIQFGFGGLFSGFTIFYFRSGSLASSWPFLIVLLSLLLGNELLRRQYERLVFQISVFFTAVFFFTIFFVPVVIREMGPAVFMLSGIAALFVIIFFIYLLSLFIPERIRSSQKYLATWISTIFIIVNVLYFTNLIPPIPLSLKGGGVYHSLYRDGSDFIVREETRSFWNALQFFDDIHMERGQPLYVYSAVFAPTDIEAEIVHHWRHFDDELNRWVSVNRIPYTIVGGTDRGHRGYSVKRNLAPGEWTVDVETPRGQVIGRITFEVIYVDRAPQLVEKVL